MKPSVVLNQHRAAIREAALRYKTKNPRVFGSVVHGLDIEGSDLDILVDALPETTLFHLGGLLETLEELLGIPIDLVTPGDLSPLFRAEVLAEALPI